MAEKKSVYEPSDGEVKASFGGPRPLTVKEEDKKFDEEELMRKIEEMVAGLIEDKIQNIDITEEINQVINSVQNITNLTTKIIESEGLSGKVRIFEVQSAATGDGVYNCYEQQIDMAEWDGTSGGDKFEAISSTLIEVLNLLENDVISSYTPALGLYDRMLCWFAKASGPSVPTVGIPLTNTVRWAKATENGGANALASTSITCDLFLNNDSDATSGQLGYNIEVWAEDCEGSPDWDEVIPTIKSGTYYQVLNDKGKWFFSFPFTNMNICT